METWVLAGSKDTHPPIHRIAFPCHSLARLFPTTSIINRRSAKGTWALNEQLVMPFFVLISFKMLTTNTRASGTHFNWPIDIYCIYPLGIPRVGAPFLAV